MPLVAAVSLVILVVVLPIGLALWQFLRICRQPDNQTTRQHIAAQQQTRADTAEETHVASEVTMERLRWNGDKSALHLRTETRAAEQIRNALRSRKINGERPGDPKGT